MNIFKGERKAKMAHWTNVFQVPGADYTSDSSEN